MRYKKYVDIVAHINRYGEMMPLFILVDQKKYKIDRVLEIKNAHSQVGGSGVRYRCKIQGNERYLFYERNRWFIESMKP